MSLRTVVSFILPHRCAPLDDIFLFGPSGNIIFYFAPRLSSFGDTIFHSTLRSCHSGNIFFYSATQLRLSRQNYSSCNPSGLFASGFLRAALAPIPTWFFKASVHRRWCCFFCNAMRRTAFCILSDAHSRLPFIGIGVAFLMTPGDAQPLHPFWRSLTRMTGHALASDNPIKNSIDTFISEGRLPLELVYYGYPQSNYWTGSFKVFFDQRSCISIQSILTKYWYKTFPISSALSRYSRILLIKRALKIDLFFCLTIMSEAWPAQFSCFLMASLYWLIFYELSSQFYSGVRLRCPPWESPLEHYLDSGMIPKSIAHTWLVLSLSCSNVSFWFGTSVFVDSFCLALHTRFYNSHELHFVLRDRDQTPPLHESFQQRIAVNQFYTCSPRSKSLSLNIE